jgi:hypothetical protein
MGFMFYVLFMEYKRQKHTAATKMAAVTKPKRQTSRVANPKSTQLHSFYFCMLHVAQLHDA